MNNLDASMTKVFGKDWKSTFSAYLTIFMTIGAPLTAYLAAIPNPKPWQVEVSGGLTIAVSIAKAIVGHMTQDAGSTPAVVPGQGVQVVPSHEVPDNPAQVPVKEQ